MEPTIEDLQRKLQLLKKEIQDTSEKRLEVEIATAVIKATSAALDDELVAMMVRHAIMDEETTSIHRLNEEYPLLDNTLPAPEDT